MVITQDDSRILAYLRNNARESIVHISRETGIPQSTVYQKLNDYEKRFIKKHTSLLDFHRLGFEVHACVVLKVNKEDRQNFLKFLQEEPFVNSAYEVNHEFDFVLECVLKDQAHLKTFIERIEEQFRIEKKAVHQLINDIKKEQFMACAERIV